MYNTLPTDIQNIILCYKAQLEHYEKFKKCMTELQNIFSLIMSLML